MVSNQVDGIERMAPLAFNLSKWTFTWMSIKLGKALKVRTIRTRNFFIIL